MTFMKFKDIWPLAEQLTMNV